MLKKISLFLMCIYISNNSYALDVIRQNLSSDINSAFAPNIALIDDAEVSNIASIPDDEDLNTETKIENDTKQNLKISDSVENKNNKIEELKSSETKSFRKIEKFVAKVAVNKPVIERKESKIIDRFDNLNIGEGEEVLVSMTSPKEFENSSNVGEKVFTNIPPKKNRKQNKTKNHKNFTPPVIMDKTVSVANSNTNTPLFPIVEHKEQTPKYQDYEGEEEITLANNRKIPKSLAYMMGDNIKPTKKTNNKTEKIYYGTKIKDNPFVKAFSALKPEKVDTKIFTTTPKFKKIEKNFAYISPSDLKKDLNRTYLSDNKYLSPVEIDEENVDDTNEDTNDAKDTDDSAEKVEDKKSEEEGGGSENIVDEQKSTNAKEESNKSDVKHSVPGATVKTEPLIDVNSIRAKIENSKKNAKPTGSLKVGTREVLQMKVDFQKESSAISGDSVNLLRSFSQIVADRPTSSIEITLPQSTMNNLDKKKLTARRLALVSNIIRESGISDRQIRPVLSNRDENSFAFRVVSNDKIEKLKIATASDIFGDEDASAKEYAIMKW